MSRIVACLSLWFVVAACGGGGDGNQAIVFSVISPTEDRSIVQGRPLDIVFTANDPDDVVLVRVLLDRDGDPETIDDQETIASVFDENGAMQTVTWDTGTTPPGTATLLLRGNDARNPARTRVIAVVTVYRAPTLTVNPIVRTELAGSVVELGFGATDPDGIATYEVLADVDCNLATTDDRFAIATGLDVSSTVVQWDTSAVPIGTYCILVTMEDGQNPIKSASAGSITLLSGEDLLFAPMPDVPLVPDAIITSKDLEAFDFWVPVWFDALDDVAAGEIELALLETANTDTVMAFTLWLASTNTEQEVLREDLRYSVLFPGVVLNGKKGDFWIQTDGTSEAGLAFFIEEGAELGELVDIGVGVLAEPGIITLGVFLDFFAFDVFDGVSADFEVVAVVERFDEEGAVADGTDATVIQVVRYLR